MSQTVHIIGGGVIGLCTAYYLNQDGYDVTVIDKGNFDEGTSYGNAGMIVPSHFIPLASPGMISKGLKYMFNSKSPFYIKPKLNSSLFEWLYKFYKSCSHKHVQDSQEALFEFNEWSKILYKQIILDNNIKCDFEEKGLLMLYKTKKQGEAEDNMADMASDLGIKAHKLSEREINNIENIKVNALGGILYPGDAHLNPKSFLESLIKILKNKGVNFLPQTEVDDFRQSSGKVDEIITNNGSIRISNLIVASGSWSAKILKKLGISILIQPGKGYTISENDLQHIPKYPTILTEAKVAITPMGNQLRIGGTLELGSYDRTVDKNRLAGILESIPKYYDNLKINPESKVWIGHRPCSPDGLPYIAKSSSIQNLFYGTGHGMMGMSMGPATGKMLSDLLKGNKNVIKFKKFDLR